MRSMRLVFCFDQLLSKNNLKNKNDFVKIEKSNCNFKRIYRIHYLFMNLRIHTIFCTFSLQKYRITPATYSVLFAYYTFFRLRISIINRLMQRVQRSAKTIRFMRPCVICVCQNSKTIAVVCYKLQKKTHRTHQIDLLSNFHVLLKKFIRFLNLGMTN